MLASCHTVQSTLNEVGRKHYSASSPDEYALVNFAKFAGTEFVKLEKSDGKSFIQIAIHGEPASHTLELLQLFEFDSNRKRQSIIVRDAQKRIFLFCKGADSVITANLSEHTDPHLLRGLNEKLKSFGS